jgi:hypothetical protein
MKIVSISNNITVCENENIKLKCPSNKVISIFYAMFGRVNAFKCRKPPHLSKLTDKCVLDIDLTIHDVKNICENKNSCEFKASSDFFSNDPCINFSKYLDDKYNCI